MGIRVHYQLVRGNGFPEQFLADIKKFSEKTFQIMEEYPDDFPALFKEKVLDIISRRDAALVTSSLQEAELIDEIVEEYWSFLDEDQDTFISSPIKLYNYPFALSDVLPHCSTRASDYYQMMLFAGRSMAECPGHTFKSPDGIFLLSWVYPHEITELKTELALFEEILKGDGEARAVYLLLDALIEAEKNRSSLVVVVA